MLAWYTDAVSRHLYQNRDMTQEYQQLIIQSVLDEDSFVRLTMKGIVRGPAAPWQKIMIRPVELRGRRQLQFSYFDAKQDVSKNYYGPEARAHLDEVLAIPYSSIVLQTTAEDVQIQLTKKGKALIHRHQHTTAALPTPDLAHDHAK